MSVYGYFFGSIDGRLRFVQSAVITTTGLIVSSALNFAALLLWIRLLPPAQFGLLALATSAGQLLNAIAFEWLRLAGARSLADPRAAHGVDSRILAAWLRVAAIAAAIVTAAIGAATLARVAPPGLSPSWNIAVLLLGASEMLLAAITLVARLRLRAATYAAAMVGRSALALGLGLVVVRHGAGAAGIVAATALVQLVITGIAVAADPLWRTAVAIRSSPRDRAALVRLGMPLIAASALALAAATVDRTLVAHSLGVAAAGRFAAPAELVAKTLGFALMAANLSAYPLLVRTWERDGPAATARALDRNLVVLLALGLPISAGLTWLAPSMAAMLFNPAAAPLAARLLPWLAGAALLRLLVTFHFGVALQLARRMGLLIIPSLVTLFILVPLAAPVIAAAGLEGFSRLLFASQAAGALTAWALARHAFALARANECACAASPMTSRPAPIAVPSGSTTAPSSVAPQ